MSLFYTVPQQHCVVIKRFNKFARVQYEGIRFKLPFVETFHTVPNWGDTANKDEVYIELTEQRTDTEPRECQTKDNATVEADASVYWKIKEPARACFEVEVLPEAIADMALNTLRSNIGKMELDEVLRDRESINRRIAEELSETAEGWGVEVKRVEIKELKSDEQTREAMTRQMEAERHRRASVAEAEGEAEAKVKVAKAEKRSSVQKAEGQAEALKKLAEAEVQYLETLKQEVGEKEAAQILIAQKYIRGFETISQNDGDKVFLPNNFKGLFEFNVDGEPRTNPSASTR